MFLALVIIGVYALNGITENEFTLFHDTYKFTFVMEVVALEAFGIAWLVRGWETSKQLEINVYLMTNPDANFENNL